MRNLLLTIALLLPILSTAQTLNLTESDRGHVRVALSADDQKTIYLHYKNEKLNTFNISELMNQYPDHQMTVVGKATINNEKVRFNFNSDNLDAFSNCTDLCLDLQSIKKYAFLGVSSSSLEDFSGVNLNTIVPASSADQMGLEVGNNIHAINDEIISTACDLSQAILQYEAGDLVEIEYSNAGNKTRSFVELGYRLEKNYSWAYCCESAKSGITVNSAIEFSVYPNPTDGLVQYSFQSNTDENSIMILSDFSGKVMMETKIAGSNFQSDYLDLSAYPNGVYLLTVQQGDSIAKEKIILQH